MFFNFWTLLPKMCLFAIASFFVALYFSSQLNFISGSSNVTDSCFWWIIFSSLQLLLWWLKQSLFFPISIATTVEETNSFNTNTKSDRMVSYRDWLLPKTLVNPLITWSCKIICQTKTIISNYYIYLLYQNYYFNIFSYMQPLGLVS